MIPAVTELATQATTQVGEGIGVDGGLLCPGVTGAIGGGVLALVASFEKDRAMRGLAFLVGEGLPVWGVISVMTGAVDAASAETVLTFAATEFLAFNTAYFGLLRGRRTR